MVIALLLPICTYAQDIEGIEVCTKMTHEQVIAKFGTPDSVKSRNADWPEESKIRSYKYGKNKLVFSDYDGLIEFVIEDNRFALIKNYINGGLKVGDSLSKIQNLNIHGPLELREKIEDGTIIYNLFTEYDSRLWILVKNGKIINIHFSLSM